MYGKFKVDDNSWAPELTLQEGQGINWTTGLPDTANPGGSSYQTGGGVGFANSRLPYASYNISGYNDLVLNSAGVSYIKTDSNTDLLLTEGSYDFDAVAPAWADNHEEYRFDWYCPEMGAGYEHKLAITYSLPWLHDGVSSRGRDVWQGHGRLLASSSV